MTCKAEKSTAVTHGLHVCRSAALNAVFAHTSMGLDLAPLYISFKLICFVQLQIMKAVVVLTPFQELFPNLLVCTERVSHHRNLSWYEPGPLMKIHVVNLYWCKQLFLSYTYPALTFILDFYLGIKQLPLFHSQDKSKALGLDILFKSMDIFSVRAVVEKFSIGLLYLSHLFLLKWQ